MSELHVRVLGPVRVEIDASAVRLSKRRHREILSLLVLAHGRTVSTSTLIDKLWDDAPAGAIGAVRTFIGELRRIVEPTRPPRTPPAILVTTPSGYALELPPTAVDLWRVEQTVLSAELRGPEAAAAELSRALKEWRGTAFEEFDDKNWAIGERARIIELRARVTEQLAKATLALGRPDDVVMLLRKHIEEHPWREDGWRMLALAHYRSARKGEALALLHRARTVFADGLGLDPSRLLVDLEQQMRSDDAALLESGRSILMQTAAVQGRGGTRSQLDSVTALLPLLARSGSVDAATEQRVATIAVAEQLADPEVTARAIVGYDVPGCWTRSDDPLRSASIVDAAARTLAVLPSTASERVRARLLATIAMESRGVDSRMTEAAEAESIARRLGDPDLLCYVLSARYLQTFQTAGLASSRERLGSEITDLATRSELPTFEIEGRLIRMQALCALDDVTAASNEADLIDALAMRFERPLASVFTSWFRYSFLDGPMPPDGDEMPGFRVGLPALARLARALTTGSTLPTGEFGPYTPWVTPLLSDPARASAALDVVPDPPHDLMSEACWYLIGRAAVAVGHRTAAQRALDALDPASLERAGGSGAIDLGPIAPLLADLTHLLGRGDR